MEQKSKADFVAAIVVNFIDGVQAILEVARVLAIVLCVLALGASLVWGAVVVFGFPAYMLVGLVTSDSTIRVICSIPVVLVEVLLIAGIGRLRRAWNI
jgi:hypothetical protein